MFFFSNFFNYTDLVYLFPPFYTDFRSNYTDFNPTTQMLKNFFGASWRIGGFSLFAMRENCNKFGLFSCNSSLCCIAYLARTLPFSFSQIKLDYCPVDNYFPTPSRWRQGVKAWILKGEAKGSKTFAIFWKSLFLVLEYRIQNTLK